MAVYLNTSGVGPPVPPNNDSPNTQRVKRGAALLDQAYFGNWREILRHYASGLDCSSPTADPLYILFGSYMGGRHLLGLDDDVAVADHGFVLADDTQAWIDYLFSSD